MDNVVREAGLGRCGWIGRAETDRDPQQDGEGEHDRKWRARRKEKKGNKEEENG